MFRKFIWRVRYVWCVAKPIVYQRMDVKTAWYCSGCNSDWQEHSPKEAAESELSYATA